MVCPSCGAAGPDQARFCPACGTSVGRACAGCARPLSATARFCEACGRPVDRGTVAVPGPDAAAPVPAPGLSAPVAERRWVTVLFCDLVGFTTLAEARDAEDVREVLSRYFDASRAVIARYGGVVEKFIGDAVMAVWGAPAANEDDAERAVRAALDLVEAVAALGAAEGAPDLRARAGVLTGEAAVTLGAEGQGMVAGDLVNTASRVQAAAQPGTVLVGEATHRATAAAIAYQAAGEHALKGKAEPVVLWRALRVTAGRRGALKGEGLEAPFVGRDRELRAVKDLFHACAEDGRAHLVSVMGVAGIGKSRLGWEFYKYMDGLQAGFLWHRGRCLAYGDGVAHWALAEMVRGRAGILEGEAEGSARAKMAAAVGEYVPDPDDRRWVEPRLLQLVGLEDRTAPDRADLFAAWRLFFERLSARSPVILAFEDMQWADPALLDFVDYLLDWSRALPIFVLAMARPELLERRPTWGAGRRNFTALTLEPLPEPAMRALLTGLVPGLPPALTARILERAEGVPLYAVETVRMLLDRGMLVPDQAAYRVAGPIEALEVPETLHALIASRLDGLAPAERRLLQDAAVLGKSFSREALAALTGLDPAGLEPPLAALLRKEVLGIQSDPRSPERGQYSFLQDLVRTLAYETLPRRDRKQRHLAAAAYLESTRGAEADELAEVVASHCLEAAALVPEADDAAAIRERARALLVRAGERAASLAAAVEAQRAFERALGLTSEARARAELRARAGRMAWLQGRVEAATAHFEQAIAEFQSQGDAHAAARVSAALADVLMQEGRLDEAVRRMEGALEVLAGDEPDADVAVVGAQLARAHMLAGDHARALDRAEEALAIAEALRLPAVLAEAMTTRGSALAWRGRLEEGEALLRHAQTLALAHEQYEAALRATNNLGWLLESHDRVGEALQVTGQGVELARRVGNRVWEWTLLEGQGRLLQLLGRWEDALQLATDLAGAVEALSSTSHNDAGRATIWIHAQRGELEAARDGLERDAAMAHAEQLELRAGHAVAQATVDLVSGDPARALRAAEDAWALRTTLGVTALVMKEALVAGMEAGAAAGDWGFVDERLEFLDRLRPGETTPYLRAHRARFGARRDALGGAADAVEAGFRSAAEAFRELAMPFWLAVTLLETAEWLGSAGRAADARAPLAEATTIFERLRARPWLERAARAAAAERVPA